MNFIVWTRFNIIMQKRDTTFYCMNAIHRFTIGTRFIASEEKNIEISTLTNWQIYNSPVYTQKYIPLRGRCGKWQRCQQE